MKLLGQMLLARATVFNGLRHHLPALAAILLLSAWFCMPLVVNRAVTPNPETGLYVGHLVFDSHERIHYVIRLSEFHDALTHGQWLVHWCRNMEGGYGYPFFNFYAPLAYYAADLWHMIGVDLFWSWKIHFFLMMALSGFALYAASLQFYCRLAAFAAAALYMLSPYHIGNLYVRGNVAEFTAMAIVPILFGGAWRLLHHGRTHLLEARSPVRNTMDCADACPPDSPPLTGVTRSTVPGKCTGVLTTALALAAIVLTHNITGQFAAGLLTLVFVLGAISMRRAFPLAKVVTAFAGGVMLSAFYWLPALYETRFLAGKALSETFSTTPKHVVFWQQYFSTGWGFGLSVSGRQDGMSFTIGVVHWLVIFFAVFLIGRRLFRRNRIFGPAEIAALAASGLFLFLLVLMSPVASPLWRIPAFAVIQFPWRLLSFASMFASVIGAFAFARLTGRFRKPLAGVLLVLLLAGSVGQLKVESYLPLPEQMYRPENTRRHFVNTNNGEFRPRWFTPPAEPSHRRVLDSQMGTVVHVPVDDVTDARFTYDSVSRSSLFYEACYFPGWKADADGSPVECQPAASGRRGLIEIAAVPGSHVYRIRLGWSTARRAGIVITAAGAVFLLAACLIMRRGGSQRRELASAVH